MSLKLCTDSPRTFSEHSILVRAAWRCANTGDYFLPGREGTRGNKESVKVARQENDTGFCLVQESDATPKVTSVMDSLLTAYSSHHTQNHLMLLRFFPSGNVSVMSFFRYRLSVSALNQIQEIVFCGPKVLVFYSVDRKILLDFFYWKLSIVA